MMKFVEYISQSLNKCEEKLQSSGFSFASFLLDWKMTDIIMW